MSNKTKVLRNLVLPLLAVTGLSFATISVLSRHESQATEPAVMPPQSHFAQTIAGIGVIEPQSELVAISPELPGVVRRIYVKIGEKLHEGAPLFTQDEREVNAQIETLEASLAASKIQAEDAGKQYELVRDVKDSRAVARDDVNKRKFAFLFAQAKVRELEAQLEQVRTTKERLTVRAPIAGEILSLNIRPGEFANAGTNAEPLVRMGDTSVLHVRVEIDEENAARVTSDMHAIAFLRGNTERKINLSFVRFEPYIRPKQNLAVSGQRVDTRVLQVIYAISSDTTLPLFTGQQVDVFIGHYRDEGKLAKPAEPLPIER